MTTTQAAMTRADIGSTLMAKIKALPAARRLQLEDYVDFLHALELRVHDDVTESFRVAFERLDAHG
jgi:hypothetical protein